MPLGILATMYKPYAGNGGFSFSRFCIVREVKHECLVSKESIKIKLAL